MKYIRVIKSHIAPEGPNVMWLQEDDSLMSLSASGEWVPVNLADHPDEKRIKQWIKEAIDISLGEIERILKTV